MIPLPMAAPTSAPWWVRPALTALDDFVRGHRKILRRLKRMEQYMATDRDMLTEMASAVSTIAIEVDGLITDRDSWKARALAAEGAAATDEAEDTQAASPVRDALRALQETLTAAQAETDPGDGSGDPVVVGDDDGSDDGAATGEDVDPKETPVVGSPGDGVSEDESDEFDPRDA